MRNLPIPVSEAQVAAFCRKYGVREFAFFGSVLRDDFHDRSDVDVLVTMLPGEEIKTIEKYLDMKDDLSAMFGGREVDLVEPRNLQNPFRRHEILRLHEVIYAA